MQDREEEIEKKRHMIYELSKKQKELTTEYEVYLLNILSDDELILTTEVLSLKDWLNQK